MQIRVRLQQSLTWSKIGAGLPLSSFNRLLIKLPQASPINAPPPRVRPNKNPCIISPVIMLVQLPLGSQ